MLSSVLGFSFTMSLGKDERAIKKAIEEFAAAADRSDVAALENCLDLNFRIVMNQLFGSKEVSVVPRSVYLQKIASKEWGGDKRAVTVLDVVVNGNTATAKVMFEGAKMSFASLLVLVEDANGAWKIVSDVPVMG